MTTRTPCCVPGCRGFTRKRWWLEYICGRHWRLVDRDLKRLRRALWSKLSRTGDVRMTDDHVWLETPRARAIERTIWRRMVRQAIERAAGL